MSNDILQPKNTDNFFVTKNKETNDGKKNTDILQKDTYSLLVDTDNNNQSTRPKNYSISNNTSFSGINVSQEQQNDNKKLYRNLRSFDPLNSGNFHLMWFIISLANNRSLLDGHAHALEGIIITWGFKIRQSLGCFQSY